MDRNRLSGLITASIVLVSSQVAWAAHPLVTDDTGTQGKGRYQVEINAECNQDRETSGGVETTSVIGIIGPTLSFGFIDDADLVLGVPFMGGKVKQGGSTVYDEKGVSDVALEVKWRFYEKDGLSLGLKPGISLPTGDEDKGLGTGKAGYHVFLIGSREAEPWAFHANVGYIYNDNTSNEEKNIWHVSAATTMEVVTNLKIVGNVGIERNPDKTGDNDPAFLIMGAIYSVRKNLDIDAGMKFGLTSSEDDLSFLLGMAYRF